MRSNVIQARSGSGRLFAVVGALDCLKNLVKLESQVLRELIKFV